MEVINRLQYEQQLWKEGYTRIMGLDEVGRGCLSGPVVAAGVILEPGSKFEGLRDSKKLSLSQRLHFEAQIKQKAQFWTIQWCTPEVIDNINILHAHHTLAKDIGSSLRIGPKLRTRKSSPNVDVW